MFGTRLKILRNEKGYSQDRLAKKMSCSQAFISKLELSLRIPTWYTLNNLKKVLDCSIYELFYEDHCIEKEILKEIQKLPINIKGKIIDKLLTGKF